MSSDKYLIRLNPQNGLNKVFDVGEYEMKLTAFAVLKLASGEVYKADTGDFEVALVLLGGKCAVKGADFDFARAVLLESGFTHYATFRNRIPQMHKL